MSHEIIINTNEPEEFIDITADVKKYVSDSKIENGLCNVYSMHTTGAIVIQENEDPNIGKDLFNVLEEIVPTLTAIKYLHKCEDDNARSHAKALLLPVSQNIPIKAGKLMLGTYQNIYFCELDGPRVNRKIILTVIKE